MTTESTVSGRRVSLDCGAGIIHVFRGADLSWKKMMCEWIDNSFGAMAKSVVFRKKGDILDVIDDGIGCSDLQMMESFARSGGNKAGMYGTGGVMSQIRATDAGKVVVESVTGDRFGKIEVDFKVCLKEGRFVAEYWEQKRLKGMKLGTTITMQPCTRRFRDVSTLISDLGHLYAGMLRTGHSIRLELDDKVLKVKPYSPPAFTSRVDFDFELDGHRITGFCGLVKRGEVNPYRGWSVHWGYRFLKQYFEPAAGKPTNRIYGEVNLPEAWSNISLTKDGFNLDVDELWDAIAERCREVIDAADAESQDIELTTASRAAEDIISSALGDKRKVKGARPGDAGEEGAVSPNGRGGEHKEFPTASQPGDKAEGDSSLPASTPDRVRINWDDTLKGVYLIATSKRGGRMFNLTLNPSIPAIAELRNHPQNLATFCLALVAREIVDGPDAPNIQKQFPAFRQTEFDAVYRTLLDRVARSKEQPPADD